jgi:thioredoxin-related protein
VVFADRILPLPAVQRSLHDVTFVHQDAEELPGRTEAARYGVDCYPTFIVLDQHGNEVARRRGLLDERAFLELLNIAKQRVHD